MDAAEFSEFYARYRRQLVGVAVQRLGNTADAEDAVSETFRIAWDRCRNGTEVDLRWVYVTLRNVIGHEYRRRKSEAGRALKLADTFPVSSEPGTTAEILDLRAAMAELADADSDILRMHYWEELTSTEVGQILGCSATAVRLRLMRARRRLARLLGPGAEDGHACSVSRLETGRREEEEWD